MTNFFGLNNKHLFIINDHLKKCTRLKVQYWNHFHQFLHTLPIGQLKNLKLHVWLLLLLHRALWIFLGDSYLSICNCQNSEMCILLCVNYNSIKKWHPHDPCLTMVLEIQQAEGQCLRDWGAIWGAGIFCFLVGMLMIQGSCLWKFTECCVWSSIHIEDILIYI